MSTGGGYLHRHVTRVDTSPGMIRQMLLERVWAKGIGRLNALYGETEPMAVEKALSELVRQNAVKEKIICKKNSFRIQLANGQYRAYRNGDKGWACPWPTERPYEIHMGGNQFAEFILLFDAEIPEMLARIAAIVDAIRARELDERRDLMETKLKETIISSVIDQFLKPLGLTVKYSVGKNDMISLDISQVLSTHLEMPLCQLLDRLKDAESIVGMLKLEPEK